MRHLMFISWYLMAKFWLQEVHVQRIVNELALCEYPMATLFTSYLTQSSHKDINTFLVVWVEYCTYNKQFCYVSFCQCVWLYTIISLLNLKWKRQAQCIRYLRWSRYLRLYGVLCVKIYRPGKNWDLRILDPEEQL